MLLAVRELVNAVLLVVDLSLVFVFVTFLRAEVKSQGWETLRAKAAFALIIYFIGMTVVRAWGFTLLWYEDINKAISLELGLPLTLVGTIIAMIGAILCVRVFSPKWWGPWGWLVTLALAAALGVFVYIR